MAGPEARDFCSQYPLGLEGIRPNGRTQQDSGIIKSQNVNIHIAIKARWNFYHDWIQLWRLDSYFQFFPLMINFRMMISYMYLNVNEN